MIKPIRSLLIAVLVLASGIASAAVINLSHTWTGTEDVQGAKRLTRDGNPSVAGVLKVFPGEEVESAVYFRIWAFDVMPGTVVTIDVPGENSHQSFFAAYDVGLDVTDLSKFYLGDSGFSGGPTAFSIDAPADGKFWIVANSVFLDDDQQGVQALAQVSFVPADQGQVPEPASLGLLAIAALALASARRRTS